MAEVSTVVATVTNALTGAISSVGESSLNRVLVGADSAAHNLIDGVVLPTTRKIALLRGYKYRNNGAIGTEPVLSFQQLQVTKTSTDPRIMRIQRDAVNLLTRACQTSDAMQMQHPTFEDIGAVHLRLTIPVPNSTRLRGFQRRTVTGDERPGLPGPHGDATDSESDSASVADSRTSSDNQMSCRARMFGAICGPTPEDPADDACSDASVPSERSHGTPLSALGNALQARETIDRMRGAWQSPVACCTCPCGSGQVAELVNQWLDIGKARGFFDKVLHIANPSGARDLYVIDVIIPTELLTTCMETADTLIGDEKPAKNLHLQKSQRKLRRLLSNKVDQPTFNYLETITHLVIMALLLDSGETGKNHCDILAYSGEQPLFKDYFANTHLEEAIEDLDKAKKEAGHPVEGIVLAIPAPEIAGSLSEKIVMYETAAFGDYELTEVKQTVGAVPVGVDLFGKPPPNDHKNPLSFISAVYRHLGDSDTTVAAGTPFEYVIHLDRSVKSALTESHDRVWEDMISDHCQDFTTLLTSNESRFDYDFLHDGKPGSYCREDYEACLEEQIADERFYTCDNALCDLLSHSKATSEHMQQLKASGSCKKGEDSSRARAVITPGVNGSEGLHQARMSPMIRALEALHAILYNHSNIKGMNEETKRIRFADFLRAVPKGAIVFGTDKSKNDACFREAVWKKCVKYLAKMNDIFEEQVITRSYVYSPNEATADQSFPKGTLDLKYWIIKLTPLLAILLSGIGPTSFFNRLESTVENGATVLEVYGEGAYQKWRIAERRAVASTHPAWTLHPLPHVAEFVEWQPLAPHMVTDTSVKCDKLEDAQIESYHMGLNEGDDQVHAIIPSKTDGWADLSIKDTIMRYSSVMSKTTNFIFEPAPTADELDMVGRNSVFEMLSAWVALPTGRADLCEVAVIVPKVLKAIRKLAHCTICSLHTIIYDANGEPADVARDVIFWSLALTKYYTIAIINHESLGVRGLFLAHGDYAYKQLEHLLGTNGAYIASTVYGDRDPEKRHIEEASSTTFATCGEARDRAHERIANVNRGRVTRVCCAAWRSELPALATEPKEKVIAALLAFDTISLSIEITDQHVSDPMLLWQELDIGCLLHPLVMHATGNHKKVATLFRSANVLADSEETVQLARQYACTKPTGSANEDRRPDNAAGAKGDKGKGKGTGDKSSSKGKGSKDAKHKSKKPHSHAQWSDGHSTSWWVDLDAKRRAAWSRASE